MTQWVKSVDFGNNVFLKKYLSDFDEEHPLIFNFSLNPEYMNYVEDLFKEVDGIPNLVIKMDELKDNSNWESSFSELEFARKVKALNPQFIKTEKSSRTPDLKVSLLGKDVFFEVKLLLENDEAHRIYYEIWKVESNLTVKVSHDALNKNQTDRTIEYIKNKVTSNSIGTFSFEGTDIEIQKRINPKTKRTALITFQRPVSIPLEPIRKKVFMEFYDKLIQFESCKPIFWVVDCLRWKYGHDDFKSIFYGTTTRDLTVGLKMYGLSDITGKAVANWELFNDTDLVPTLTYPMKNGLFFLNEAECLNGVVSKTHGNTKLLLNPFAKHQLDTDSIRQLRALLAPS
jgi:hypothetical protein